MKIQIKVTECTETAFIKQYQRIIMSLLKDGLFLGDGALIEIRGDRIEGTLGMRGFSNAETLSYTACMRALRLLDKDRPYNITEETTSNKSVVTVAQRLDDCTIEVELSVELARMVKMLKLVVERFWSDIWVNLLQK